MTKKYLKLPHSIRDFVWGLSSLEESPIIHFSPAKFYGGGPPSRPLVYLDLGGISVRMEISDYLEEVQAIAFSYPAPVQHVDLSVQYPLPPYLNVDFARFYPQIHQTIDFFPTYLFFRCPDIPKVFKYLFFFENPMLWVDRCINPKFRDSFEYYPSALRGAIQSSLESNNLSNHEIAMSGYAHLL